MGTLERMEKTWVSLSRVGGGGGGAGGAAAEERERNAFVSCLRDGVVLCL